MSAIAPRPAARATKAPESPVMFPRRRKRISGRSIAVLVFLTMAAAFFCIPLYVLIVTSFKSMDQIREGAIFSLPTTWSWEAWNYAWNEACSGITCEGLKVGFWNSVRILVPSLIASISLSAVTGYALALWNVRWAGTFLFVLFMAAFVPFQIIMFPLIQLTVKLGIYGSLSAVAFTMIMYRTGFLLAGAADCGFITTTDEGGRNRQGDRNIFHPACTLRRSG